MTGESHTAPRVNERSNTAGMTLQRLLASPAVILGLVTLAAAIIAREI